MISDVVTPTDQPLTGDALDSANPSAIITDDLPQPRRFNRFVVLCIAALILLLFGGSILVVALASQHVKSSNYEASPRPSVLPAGSSSALSLKDVLVNGQLYVNNSVVLKPTTVPANPTLGQLYLNDDTNQLNYYNGSQFVAVTAQSPPPADTVLGVSNNSLRLGNGLTLIQDTLVNSGVTDLLGTQNQIAVSSASGNTVLGLPSNVSIFGSMSAGNFIGSGASVTNLNANNLTAGTVNDSELSQNVALLNNNDQGFRGRRQLFQNTSDDSNAFSVQAADGTPELNINTLNNTITTADLLPAINGNSYAGYLNAGTAISPINSYGYYNDSGKWLSVGSDGFARFVYQDNNYTTVQLVRCLNASCSSFNNTTVATDSNDVDYSSMQMGPDHFPRITYITYDTPNQLHYVQCLNADCSSKTDTTVATGSYYENAFTLDSSGFARISYSDYTVTPSVMDYLQCLNAACTSTTTPVTFTNANSLSAQDIAMAPDGLPTLLYGAYNYPNFGNLYYVTCHNQACSSSTILNLTGNNSGSTSYYYSRLLYDKNQLPGISFQANASSVSSAGYISCDNIACSLFSNTTLFGSNVSTVSSTIGSNGYPIMAIAGEPETFVYCVNETCSSNTKTVVDTASGYPSSITLGNDGFGRIVDYNSTTKVFDFIQINTTDGQPVPSNGTNIGTNTDRYSTIYSGSNNTEQETVQSAINSTSAFQVQDASGSDVLSVDTLKGAVEINNLNVTNIGTGYSGPSYGLKGYWFNNSGGYDGSTPVWNETNHTSDGSNAVATTIDGPIDYSSMLADHPAAFGPAQQAGSQSQAIQGINVHWEGWITADYTGVYTFYSQADDEESVSVNNQQVINNWNCCSLPEASGTISLVAGQWYPISVDYGNHSYDGTIYLKWSEANVAKELVPADNFVNSDPASGLPSVSANTIQVSGITAYQSVLQDASSSGSYLQFNPTYNQSGAVQISTRSASNVGLLIQGSNAQSADLLDLQNSSGQVVGFINNIGTQLGLAKTTNKTYQPILNNDVTNGIFDIDYNGQAGAVDPSAFGGLIRLGQGAFSVYLHPAGSPTLDQRLTVGPRGDGFKVNTFTVLRNINSDGQANLVLQGSDDSGANQQFRIEDYTAAFGKFSNALTTAAGNLTAYGDNTRPALVTQGASGQTADLLQAQTSTGNVLAKIDASGNLTVVAATINGTLTVNGNVVTGGGTPAYTSQSNRAGGAACDNAPTIALSGTDTDGLITITTPNAGTCGAGALVSVNFVTQYSNNAPNVTLTAANAAASAIQYYVDQNSTNGTSFRVTTNTAVATNTVYKYYYTVLD